MADGFTFNNFNSNQNFNTNGVSQSPQGLTFHKTHHAFAPSPTNAAQNKAQLPPYRPDPKSPLPLSLFGVAEGVNGGEIDREKGKFDGDYDHDHGGIGNGRNNGDFNELGVFFGLKGGSQDLGIGKKVVLENGSGLDFDDDDDFDDGEWEFRGAVSGDCEGQEVVTAPLENQAGQGTYNSVKNNPGLSSFSLQSNDLFAAFLVTDDKSNGKDVVKTTSVMPNGFMWDAFPGAEDSNGSTANEPGFTSSVPQSHDLFVDSVGAGNRSNGIDSGDRSTSMTSNGFTWNAFAGVENIGSGSEISDSIANSVEHKGHSSSHIPPVDDLFAVSLGVVKKSDGMNVGFEPTTVTTNTFGFDVFPVVQNIGNGKATSVTSPGLAEHKPGSGSFLPPDNLFMVPQGDVNRPNETFGSFKPTSVTANGFMFNAFPDIEVDGNGNGLSGGSAATTNDEDDFDDFGDFIDASQEVRTREQEQIVSHMAVAEAQLEISKAQDTATLLVNSREALPLSLFGESTEETSETLNRSDELVHKPTSNPGNVFNGQDSVVSIHDLISNLYGQAQSTLPVGSNGELAETGFHNCQEEAPPLVGDDEWDDDSWEFKGAFQETGVKENPLSSNPGNIAQIKLENSQNAKKYIDFYTELRDSLCLLLSCQLDELQKARCSDAGTRSPDSTETVDNEIQEVHKLLDQSLVSQVVSKKHLEKSSCLNEVFKILEGSEFKMIESEYPLSKSLQLAANDWRVASDILRHAISILKILSLGSAEEQSLYACIWSSIINVCTQELRYGALIWKKASEKKVQRQVLSHRRGQMHIQALGEIRKVVELLGLSAKVYKAWILFSVSDSSQFMDLLNECRALWSGSGLEEALQNLSDDIDFGCEETAKALLASIKNIRDFDPLNMHDCVRGQHKSLCRLSLLPQEMLPDLKTVVWNGDPYFVSLANLWANLISREPPQLQHVLACQTGG